MVQGSQIGPLLFIIFVNDIIDLTIKPSVCKLFADDVKLYSKIQYPFTNSLTQTCTTADRGMVSKVADANQPSKELYNETWEEQE